jgi:hypothetical protein
MRTPSPALGSSAAAWRGLSALVLCLLLAACATPQPPGPSPRPTPSSTVEAVAPPAPSPTALASASLAAIRADIESRYADQLTSIGDGAGVIVLTLKPTATAAAAQIVDQYGSAVQVTVGFLPYPGSSASPTGCPMGLSLIPKPSGLRAAIDLPTTRISHGMDFEAKVTLTTTSSTPIAINTGQPLSIYVFEPGGSTPVGRSPGPVAGTGLGFALRRGTPHDVDAVGGTASCDLRLGYELPDGPYIARAAVEIDGSLLPGSFWSDPLQVQLVTP